MAARNIQQFIADLYGDNHPGFVSVWSKQSKKTRYFSNEKAVALVEFILQSAQAEDLYLAFGLQNDRLPAWNRGDTAGVRVLPGFFADIDFRSDGKANAQYPADEAEALRILDEFPIKPTLLIKTGGGLHAHFLLTKLHTLNSVEERDDAVRLWAAFQRKLRAHFRSKGRDIDSVGDLTRLYRMPSTFNHKTGTPQPVELIERHIDRRYELSTIREFATDAMDEAEPEKASDARSEFKPADHQAIVEGCAWYANVTGDGAATCDEPNWHAAASITSRCEDSERIFHEYSARHPKYTKREAERKFARAPEEAGPRTCQAIEYDLGHDGCAGCRFRGKVTSPIQLGRKPKSGYDPGKDGPIPQGYLPDGQFVFFDQKRRLLIVESSSRLISLGTLFGLAPAEFWFKRFVGQKGKVDALGAGIALMDACRAKGGFDPSRVRGRGVYVDKGRIVLNFGDEVPSDSFTYVCWLPLRIDESGKPVEPDAVLAFFRLFNFASPSAAFLLFGWTVSAVVCGALDWRTHVFLTGAKNTGKTTLVNAVRHLIEAVAVALDGQSTEAGIRQTLGPDARPVILDEFESDQNLGRMRAIIKLVRSASSGALSIARGTPEGKALEFRIRASFMLAAINPMAVTAADRSRIVTLGLDKHGNDKVQGRKIAEASLALEGRSGSWCRRAMDLTLEILASIRTLQLVFPPTDSRHALNMATLLGAAWTMLNGRAIDEASATALIEEHRAIIEELAEAHEEDDAEECLGALLEYHPRERDEERLLGGVLASIKRMMVPGRPKGADGNALNNHRGLIERHGMKISEEGLIVANSHRGLVEVFRGTQWETGNWGSSLKRLPGASATKQRRFSEDVRSIGTLIPWTLIPDPEEVDRPF